jgi:hypothetical protein
VAFCQISEFKINIYPRIRCLYQKCPDVFHSIKFLTKPEPSCGLLTEFMAWRSELNPSRLGKRTDPVPLDAPTIEPYLTIRVAEQDQII